ncbi:MAG: hypothetical protein Q8O10_03740 [candidate division Zixibacteria bacterium]|nr:hypothetical protein [candidate division Zixibacteria bacterium]
MPNSLGLLSFCSCLIHQAYFGSMNRATTFSRSRADANILKKAV